MTQEAGNSADPPAVIDGRVQLAAFRTKLALDRTMLAWVRTTLTMATFGLGLVGFFRSLRQSDPSPESAALHQGAINFGASLIVLGIVATVVVSVSHLLALRRLRNNQLPAIANWSLSVMVALLVVAAGIFGIWVLRTR